MTKRSRNGLFIALALIFLLAAPAAFFYSQGYRIDFHKWKMVQTGGLYFRIAPKSTQVYLDGKLKKKTDFFFGSVLIDNLLPKKYKVELQKEGFQLWSKELEVLEKQVIDAKNVVLFPQKTEFLAIDKNILGFYFSPDEKWAVINKSFTASSASPIAWSLSLYDPKRNITSFLLDNTKLPGQKKNTQISDITWSLDSKRILIKTFDSSTRYFIADIDQNPALPISLDFLGKEPGHISIDFRNGSQLIFEGAKEAPTPLQTSKTKTEQGKSLFRADYKTKKITGLKIGEVITYEISADGLFWLTTSGRLFKSDLLGLNPQQLNTVPLEIKKGAKYQLQLGQYPEILLRENNFLYIFDADPKTFQKISDSAKNIEFSTDYKKIFLADDKEIWVYYLQNQDTQPLKKAGDKSLLINSGSVGETFWLTDYYIIFSSGDNLKAAEIDDRSHINIADIGKFKNPKIFVSQSDKNIFVLSQGNLYISETLVK